MKNSNKSNYISIGKIVNFFGIKGEAKVGYSNFELLKKAKKVYILGDNLNNEEVQASFTISSIRPKGSLSKGSSKGGNNFAIIKFKEIDDINDLVPFKGQKIYLLESEVHQKLDNDEYLIKDLIDCKVIDTKGVLKGIVSDVTSNGIQDILSIKNPLGQVSLVPFVGEFFPSVDVKNKTVTIKPIEGLLN